ncbi:CRM domain-containing protein [Heracleum sosnowskyi]|uniref:CRM domain-containing protein n=1 Tax=Heracleum sosnowskyi TaxID=360622 RepID=A0AAD8MRA0_9APIA|nr:CRM domain-containing protein [Heracleum sosnowskyi]
MALFRRVGFRSLLKPLLSPCNPIVHLPHTISKPLNSNISSNTWWVFKNYSHGSVNLVISQGDNPRFETHKTDPPKKHRFLSKKRLKERRKKEKQIRKSANKRDPRRLGVKGNKGRQRFANAEERIMFKLQKAKIKEGLLLERLQRYEVPKVQGPLVQPHALTGEERFYMKKMAQKRSNYVPIGRRGVFGGVVLNMHMHWKKHETVKVICKPCKPGQVQDYASDIARLSGGIPIHIIGDDTIIFYRGKDYVQPKVMSPIDTLSKKRALEKSKYEQSLETVRRFIAIAEKELELYYRHIALYGDPSNRNPNSSVDSPVRGIQRSKEIQTIERGFPHSDTKSNYMDYDLSENEDGYESGGVSLSDFDEDDGISSNELNSGDEEYEDNTTNIKENSVSMSQSASL